MVSIALLMKIIGGGLILAGWLWLFQTVRQIAHRLECLREHCEARIGAVAQAMPTAEEDIPEELNEARLRAMEAERRFTEGVASILNFSIGPAAVAEQTTRKGDM